MYFKANNALSELRYLNHLKIRLGYAAVRALPIIGNVSPSGARGNAFFRQAFCFVIVKAAHDTLPSFHRDSLLKEIAGSLNLISNSVVSQSQAILCEVAKYDLYGQ